MAPMAWVEPLMWSVCRMFGTALTLAGLIGLVGILGYGLWHYAAWVDNIDLGGKRK